MVADMERRRVFGHEKTGAAYNPQTVVNGNAGGVADGHHTYYGGSAPVQGYYGGNEHAPSVGTEVPVSPNGSRLGHAR